VRITTHTPARLPGRGAGHCDTAGHPQSTPGGRRLEPLRARLVDHLGAEPLRAVAERYRTRLAELRAAVEVVS
jgi:hypothetical protein